MRLRNTHFACLLLVLLSPSPAPAQSETPTYGTPGTHITVLENTLIRVMTDRPLDTRHSKTRMPIAIGVGAVEAIAVVSPKPVVNIPTESQMDFYLSSPISIQSVTRQEAERLAQRMKGTDPVLYIRSDIP